MLNFVVNISIYAGKDDLVLPEHEKNYQNPHFD